VNTLPSAPIPPTAERGAGWLRHPASAILLMVAAWAAPAHATRIDQVSTSYNFYGISGNDGSISSTLDCSVGLCTVYNELYFGGGDASVMLRWRDRQDRMLLSGQVPWDIDIFNQGPNRSIGRTSSVTYAGWFITTPNWGRYTGTADFSGSRSINPLCEDFVCDQDYLELYVRLPNPLPNGRQPADGGPSPGAIEEPWSIRWAMSELSLPYGAPLETEPTRSDAYSFVGSVVSVGDEFLYSYELINHTLMDLDVTLDALGWSGRVDGNGLTQWSMLSALPPRAVHNELVASSDDVAVLVAAFEVLQPVPEPATGLLWGLGLAGLWGSRGRLRGRPR